MLTVEDSQMTAQIDQLDGELADRGMGFRPHLGCPVHDSLPRVQTMNDLHSGHHQGMP